MPHKTFDNIENITMDDITVAILQFQNNNEFGPQDSQYRQYMTQQGSYQNDNAFQHCYNDDQWENHNSTYSMSDLEMGQYNNNQSAPFDQEAEQNPKQNCAPDSSMEEEEEQEQEIEFEKCKIIKKDILLHDDMTNRQVVEREIQIKVDGEKKIQFSQILQTLGELDEMYKILNEGNFVFFLYDPSRKLYVHLPYTPTQSTFIMYDFLQNQDCLKIKFRQHNNRNENGNYCNSVSKAVGCNRDFHSQYQSGNNNISDLESAAPSADALRKQREFEVTEEYYESLKQMQPMPREKERSIEFAVKNVLEWRNYLKNGINYKGFQIKLNLNQAAQLLGIRRKTLDEYYKQIKEGISKQFQFQVNLEKKIGILRKFNKEVKYIHKEFDEQDLENIIQNQNEEITVSNTNYYKEENKSHSSNQNLEDKDQNFMNGNFNNGENKEIFSPIGNFENQMHQQNIEINQQSQFQYDEDYALCDQLEQFSDNENENNNLNQEIGRENSFYWGSFIHENEENQICHNNQNNNIPQSQFFDQFEPFLNGNNAEQDFLENFHQENNNINYQQQHNSFQLEPSHKSNSNKDNNQNNTQNVVEQFLEISPGNSFERHYPF